MQQELLRKIAAAAKESGASENACRTLIALARDPHGIDRLVAPVMVASRLNVSTARANEGIIELLARNVVVENGGTPPRLEVDLVRLGLSGKEIAALKSRRPAFVNHGTPHSDAAMESLERFFTETEGPIYVALEVTSPLVFKRLRDRAESGRRTIFLMPRKRHVADLRQTHYSEMMNSWVSLFLQGESCLRKNTELRLTSTSFDDLYTSALSNDLARFDVHFLNSETTREGDLLEVTGGTTLYLAIHARYTEALAKSCPLWRVWWWKALGVWSRRVIVPVLLLGVGLALVSSKNPYAAVVSTVALGLIVNLISNYTGLSAWYRKTLFSK